MSDGARVKALAEELEQCPKYSLHIANLRQEICQQVDKAPPVILDALASVLGIRREI